VTPCGYTMGELGVEYAVKSIKGEDIPKLVPVETDLITAADLTTASGTATAKRLNREVR